MRVSRPMLFQTPKPQNESYSRPLSPGSAFLVENLEGEQTWVHHSRPSSNDEGEAQTTKTKATNEKRHTLWNARLPGLGWL